MAAFLAYQATSLIRELPQTPAATARRHSGAMESCRTASASVMSIWRGGRNLRPPPTAHPSQTLGKHSNDIFICSVGIQTPEPCRNSLPQDPANNVQPAPAPDSSYFAAARLLSSTPFLPCASSTRCSLVRAYSSPIFTSCQT